VVPIVLQQHKAIAALGIYPTSSFPVNMKIFVGWKLEGKNQLF